MGIKAIENSRSLLPSICLSRDYSHTVGLSGFHRESAVHLIIAFSFSSFFILYAALSLALHAS